MKELPVKDNELLDNVVKRLIDEKNKGNQAFAIFNDVKLCSDDISLDGAYEKVCGYPREEFYRRIKEKNELIRRELNETEQVLHDVMMAKLFFLTKNNKIYSYDAEEYITKMSKYSNYCKTDKQAQWESEIRKLVYMAGEATDKYILSQLYAREQAGLIMEEIEKGKSWNDISELVNSQVYNLSLLGEVMLEYSPYGIDFVDSVIGEKEIMLSDNLNSKYEEAKKSLSTNSEKRM